MKDFKSWRRKNINIFEQFLPSPFGSPNYHLKTENDM
jgi:hypothetical protein